MNIGIVTTWFERGAAYVSRQYQQVITPGHKVYIYARGGEAPSQRDERWDDPTVTRAQWIPFSITTAVDLHDFRTWLRVNQIELVLFNEQRSWPAVLACNAMGIITGAYVDYYTEETVPLFDVYDFLVCNTRRHHSAFDWHPQCWYIPWGTDLDLFHPQPRSTVSSVAVRFFHSAGMSPGRKGTDLLIQAFAQLTGDAHLIIHAQTKLQSSLPALAAVIDNLKQAGRLTIVEETISAPGLYHLGDIYVYPTRLEGIGLTIAEALACGLPVITTDAPPMNEFVQRDRNGQLVGVERSIARADGYYWPQSLVSLASLNQAMHYYIDHADRIDQFRYEARAYAEQYLDWRVNAASLPDRMAHVHKRPLAETADASQRALASEARKLQFVQKYPVPARWLGRLLRPLRRR